MSDIRPNSHIFLALGRFDERSFRLLMINLIAPETQIKQKEEAFIFLLNSQSISWWFA